MEQKCTIERLIEILNKITKSLGFGSIEKLTLIDFHGHYTYEK